MVVFQGSVRRLFFGVFPEGYFQGPELWFHPRVFAKGWNRGVTTKGCKVGVFRGHGLKGFSVVRSRVAYMNYVSMSGSNVCVCVLPELGLAC